MEGTERRRSGCGSEEGGITEKSPGNYSDIPGTEISE